MESKENMRVLFPTLPRLYALVALQWAPQDDLSVSLPGKIQECISRGDPVASPRHLCRAESRD